MGKILKIIIGILGLILVLGSLGGYAAKDWVIATITLIIGLGLAFYALNGYLFDKFYEIKHNLKTSKNRKREVKTVAPKSIAYKEKHQNKETEELTGHTISHHKTKGGITIINQQINSSQSAGRPILTKNYATAVILSILLGWLGVDRFYVGHVGLGILKLITLGGSGLWWIIDIILFATKKVSYVKWE